MRAAALLEKRPRASVLRERKRLAGDMAGWLRERGAWLTSIPGMAAMRFEAVPDSAVPEELRKLGYVVIQVGAAMRIVGDARTELLTMTSGGTYEPATAGSSKPPQMVVQHAGIIRVDVFALSLPPGAKPK